MLIIPDSTIKLYHNVPLDAKYNNTVLFGSVSAQNNYFHSSPSSILSFSVEGNSYARVERKKLRIQKPAKDCYNCNYLAFRNTSFGEKWFYAFVTSVEYVNPTTTEIEFELDVMQTFLFDVTLKESFVLREHAVNDTVGANLLSEPVEIGELTMASTSESSWFTDYCIVASYQDPRGNSESGRVYHNVPSCSNYAFFDSTSNGIEELRIFLDMFKIADKLENVNSIFMVPKAFAGVPEYPYFLTPDKPASIGALWVSKIDSISKPNTLNGYAPRNKKLLTYPYRALRVDCGANQKVYKYEYFNDGTDYATFQLAGCYACNPEIAVIPKHYMSAPNTSNALNYSEECTLTGFPEIPYANDAYRSWIANKATMVENSELIGLGTMLLGVGVGMATANPLMAVSAGMGGYSAISNGENQWNVAQSTLGTSVVGRASSSIDTAMLVKKPYYISLEMRADLAQRADDYLDRFGYNTQKLKIPNRSSRPHWNYVKTAGCNVVGNVPIDYLNKIISIYDRGITFWKSPSEVGNYSLNNH